MNVSGVYIPVSVMMFLEYAVWGAWAPVLAARLLGPLKMSGKQTGWIYATLPLACMISPLVAGSLTDKWVNAEWVLIVAHLAGAALLFAAARCQRFTPLFVVMLLYSIFYAATLPLVNAVLFSHVEGVGGDVGKVFIWAPVAWALIGYILTGWRWIFKTEGEGRDCLYLAAVLSLLMGLACLFLPATPPAGKGTMPIAGIVEMLRDSNFLVFFIVSIVIAGMMQFYFLGTARFMQDIKVPGKNVPASMAIAQIVQAAATWFALGYFLQVVGFKNTLLLGAGCWLVMYIIYVSIGSRWPVVASQSLHGLAYVFFIIVGQIFVDAVARPEIRGSMQAVIFFATVGVGMFLGTQSAGVVMDKFSVDGRFQWRKIWLVPMIVVLIGIVLLATLFNYTPPAGN